MKINRKVEVQVDVKTMEVSAKVSDRGCYTLKDQEGNEVAYHDGHVPNFFPGQHYGDYLILNIELDTGKILNWIPPTAAMLEKFIENANEGKV